MQGFVMMVGISGSGKDTFIQKDSYFNDFVIVSTDQVRKNLGYPQGTIKDVFDICFTTIIDALTIGQNVVFNATNLKNKNRISLLERIRQKFGDKIYCEAYVVITPFKLCKERNAARVGFDRVPDKVLDQQLRSFQIPVVGEGFDNVVFVQSGPPSAFCDSNGRLKEEYRSFDYINGVGFYDFEQDNPYHSLSLGEHMDATRAYVREILFRENCINNIDDARYQPLLNAASWHDVGKVITKDYHDRAGNPSKTAHYYGHENVGAYIVLSEFFYVYGNYSFDFDMYVKMATYINYHMRVSFTWRKYPNGKCAKRERKIFSDFDLWCLELLGEADRAAH